MQPKSTIVAPLPHQPSRRAAARAWLRRRFSDFKADVADTWHMFGGAATAIICCMVLFVVCLAVYVGVNAARQPAAPKAAAAYTSFAIGLCRDQMKLELRSPSAAKFPSLSSARTTVAGNEVGIRDYVDSPNAFGTPVRTAFGCVVELSSDNSMGTITDFDTYPR